MTRQQDLTAANGRIANALVTRAGGLASQAFRNLGSWRDDDIDRYLSQIAPALSGIKRESAKSTIAFYKQIALETGQDFTQPVITASDIATKTLRNGVDTSMVYRRPFVDMRTALSKGKNVSEAIEAGARRANSLASTEVQLARRGAGLKARSANDNIVGYVRTLTGLENCGLCYVASTQRYTRGNLLPIHPGCDCGEMPIYGNQDPGQVINDIRLEAAHENVQQRFGISDRGGREIDYRKIQIQEHGEMGPVLTVRGNSFSGTDNLEFKQEKYTSIDNLVSDADSIATDIDITYDYKAPKEANGNVPMQVLMEKSGKGGKPTVVNSVSDLSENQVWYRGASNDNIDGFVNKDRHRIGLGVYGDGYYFAETLDTAESYARMSQGKVMKAGLKPNAKIFEIERVVQGQGSDIASEAADKLNFYVNGKFPSEAEEAIAENYFANDTDAFTTDLILQGYDGFRIKQTPTASKESYLVVFNRQAMEVVDG